MTNDQIEVAKAALNDLLQRRNTCFDKIRDLKAEVNRLSYGALVEHDAKAQKRLDEINRDLANTEFQQSTLTAAITESERRISEAKALAQAAEKIDQAKQRLALAAELREIGRKLDAGFSGELAHQLWALGTRINRAGSVTPSSDQIRVLGLNALYTKLMGTPWAKEFRVLAPSERKTFEQICSGWADTIENAAQQLVGKAA